MRGCFVPGVLRIAGISSRSVVKQALEMDRRIVILGFMACGKTTVAKELARALDASFIDLDSFIADREGRSPARIIPADGEPSFRQTETAVLNEVLTQTDARIIALGGGTFTVPE